MARGNFNTMWRYTNAGGKRAATRTIDTANDGDTLVGQDSITIGSSTTAESHTSASSKALAGYVTTSSTSGSTSYEPWYFKTTLTGAGQVGGRLLSHTYTNVALGGWVNAIKGNMEFGASGSTSGLASAVLAEMTAPNQTVPSGHYYPLELEMTFGASTSVNGNAGSGTGFIYAKINGTTTTFEDEGGLFWLDGVTSGTGNIYYGNTIRTYVTSSHTEKYFVLSGTENSLDLGAATTPIDLSGAFTTGIQIDADGTTALSVTNNFSGTNVISIAGSGSTAAINVSGTAGTVLDVTGAFTTGISLDADGTTGMEITSNFTGTTGILVAGTSTNAVSVTGNATSAFTTGTGTFGAGLTIGGTVTTGISIGAVSGNAIEINTDDKIQLRDSGVYVHSDADGAIKISADTAGILLDISGSSASKKIVFGGETDWGTGATGTVIDGTGYDWVTQTVGRVNSDLNATAAAASYYALSVTASQTTTNSIFGTWTELYFSNSVDLTGSSNYAAVWGQVEAGTSVTGPDQSDGDFMTAGYFNFKTGSTFTTGSYVNGVRVQSEVSATTYTKTSNTWMAGVEVLTKSGYQNWTHGLHISGADVGIMFGDAFGGPTIQTGTYQSTADGGMILTSSNTFNAAFLADDSGSNIGASVRNVLGRTLLTVSQTAGSIRSVMGQLKLLDAVNLGTGVYTGVQGYIELAGDTTIQSGAKTSGMDISVEVASTKTLTVASGGLFAGLHIETTGAGTIANSGNCAAIYIDDGGTVTDWPVGIDINNCSQPINAVATMAGASAVNGNVFTSNDATTGSSGYARGLYVNYTASGTKTGTAEANGVGVDMTVTGNTPFARALTLYTNATGTTTIGTMNALDIYMDDEAGTVTQTGKRAINIGIDHGNDKGTCDMIVFRCHGGTVDNVFKFTDTTGSPYTNFISIDGICGFVSAETNTTFAGDGVKIAIDVGGSTYYLRACSAFS